MAIKNGLEYTYKTLVHSDEREARNVRLSFSNGFGNYKEFNRELVKGTFQLPENKISINDIPMQVEVYISFESSIGKNISIAMFILMSRMDGIEN